MKKLTLATLSTLAFTLACTNVFAVNGTITVNGVVTDQTCTLRGDDGMANGLKNLTVSLPTLPKSTFTPLNRVPFFMGFNLHLRDATGTDFCEAATRRAFRGIHLSAISPAHLDAEDKTLLVNTSGASVANPVFIQFYTVDSVPVDFSASWADQAKSTVQHLSNHTFVYYRVQYASKTGIVDAQNVNAKINYTLMYN
ncbi:fimbrial protein [Acinetobacter guillouiae]|jgi:major type 1 subunit fimbrin (pilin)|uniref:fimbrial protein n=1 Tax=Acinetobacter guillouiae TaxID=106649 RepID=UPI0026E2723E|nr:type 1 fimbrial protein [Acinetobacter guillouiae]MDO6644619.1 type 1 fimbrial protein [Acinetobacter guillouiae]